MNDEALRQNYAAEVASRTAATEEELRGRIADRLATIGEMTAGIVHDFRSVLTVIQSSLNLAQNAGSREESEAYIAAAIDGITRGTRLSDRLLTLAKQGPAPAQSANANDLLRKVEMFLRYCVGPEIHVVLDLAADIPNFIIEPVRFNAAILNIVINARDAMPNGGGVIIATARCDSENSKLCRSPQGRYVCVRIHDTGCGIPAELLSKVFAPFFTTKGERGTGLGLPQIRTFVEEAGGQITIASEIGIGTTVNLLFLASEMGQAPASSLTSRLVGAAA